jgi:hypothetical protein
MQLPLRPASFKETAMGSMISFAEILGAIFMSFAVALTLQWIGLVALMRLMPAKKADLQRAEMEASGARRKDAELTLITRERKSAA